MRLGQVQSKSATAFEGADARVGQSPFEGASFAFAVFDVDDALDPGLGEYGVVLYGEPVESDVAQALTD